MKRQFAIILLCLFSIQLRAQENFVASYIIKNSGDTVKGYIKNQENSFLTNKIYFKQSPQETPVTFLPGEIKGFELDNGRLYKSILYEDVLDKNKMKTVFGKVLLEGYYSVFSIMKEEQAFYFIKSESDHGFFLYDDVLGYYRMEKEGNYRRVLGYIATHCEKAKNRLEQIGYHESEIVDLVQIVNSCISPASKSVVHYQHTKTKIGFVAFAGGMPTGSNTYQLTFEGLLRLSFPEISAQTSLLFGFTYGRRSLVGVYQQPGLSYDENITRHLYSIPVLVQYSITQSVLQPFIFAGLSYSVFKENTDIKTLGSSSTTSNQFYPLFGAGLEYSVLKNMMIKAEWKYEFLRQKPVIGMALAF